MIAIIPARGGSKGILNKNIQLLGGRPLIHWTIEAAINAKCIKRVVLSTDSKKIADICKPTGIEIPFLRPSELSQDNSLAIDNYIYTMERLINEFEYNKNEFVVLLPTVPFRNATDIENAVDLFYENNSDSVISCTKIDHPTDWIFTVDKNGLIEKKNDKPVEKLMNRQVSNDEFLPNGGIYVFRYSLLKDKYDYYFDKTHAYIMPKERSIDIDTQFDLEMAEYFYKKL